MIVQITPTCEVRFTSFPLIFFIPNLIFFPITAAVAWLLIHLSSWEVALMRSSVRLPIYLISKNNFLHIRKAQLGEINHSKCFSRPSFRKMRHEIACSLCFLYASSHSLYWNPGTKQRRSQGGSSSELGNKETWGRRWIENPPFRLSFRFSYCFGFCSVRYGWEIENGVPQSS